VSPGSCARELGDTAAGVLFSKAMGEPSMRKTLASPRHAHFPAQWHMAPVVDTGDYAFFSGVTGVGPSGRASSDPETQFRDAFHFLNENLQAAGLSFKNVVDLTSYHVDLHQHANSFLKVKDEFIFEPYPAWTAIGVSQLWFADLLVELHIIAKR
jgi:enamine deaminase RidA (YjgF/YER057c/UK114 family)